MPIGSSLPFVYPLDRQDDNSEEEGDQAPPRFMVGEEALAVLKSITLPIAPIAIVGRYRTGKSFLLNKLIGSGAKAFSVGDTIEACTRGINLWSEPLELQNEDGTSYAVLFLDTEGVSSTAADSEHDARIFSLAVLLSSLIVYNSVGVIDEDAISNLGFVANLTRHIQSKSEINNQNIEEKEVVDNDNNDDDDESLLTRTSDRQIPFPSFIWVLRDFALELRDSESGETISAREYLEQSLAQQSSFSTDAQARNRVRRSLTGFFKRRDCFTLVRPVDDEEQLAQVDTLPESSLRETFRSQLTELRSHILDDLAKPKVGMSGKGEFVTGRMLGGLACAYVAAINARAVPSISNAWDGVTRLESMESFASSTSLYENGILQDAHSGLLPLEEDVLISIHNLNADRARSLFKSRAVGPSAEKYLKELEVKLAEGLKGLELRNASASESSCSSLIETLWNERISEHASHYFERNNQAKFTISDDLDALRNRYFELAKGPAAHKQMSLFLSSKVAIPMLLRTVCSAREVEAGLKLSEAESKNSTLESELYMAKATNEATERLASDLRRQCEKLKADVARTSFEAATEKEKVSKLEISLRNLTEEYETLKSDLKNERMAYATLKFARKEEGSEEKENIGESKNTQNNNKKKTKKEEEEEENEREAKESRNSSSSQVNGKPLKISTLGGGLGFSENALTPISKANFVQATALVPPGQGIAGITARVVFPDIKREKGCCEIQ